MRAGAAAVSLASPVVALASACSDLSGLSGDDPVTTPDGGADQASPATDSGSGNSDSSGGDSSTTSLDEACAKVAEALCSRFTLCVPSLVQSAYGGPIACTTQHTLTCVLFNSAPGSVVTAAQLDQCATDIVPMTCEDLSSGVYPASCRAAGTVQEGGSCIADPQCTTGYCAELDTAGCGRCRTPLGVDEPCGSPGCGHGLVCGSNNKCIVPRGLDQDCQGPTDCMRTLTCGAAGKCVSFANENDACGTGSGTCNLLQAFACSMDTQSCVKQVAIAPGMECKNYNGVGPICLGGLCRPNGTTPVCTAFAKEGEACTNLPCIEPFKCNAGQCVKPKMSFCPL